MAERMIPRSHARDIADLAVDLSDKAHEWKARALAAEAMVKRFCDWLDRADKPEDDCAYLNGCHPDQRAADRDGWDDLRDLVAEAKGAL